MNIKHKTIFLILILISSYLWCNLKVARNANELYYKAEKKAKKLNKKLLVLGSPHSMSGKFVSIYYKSYGCGDVCIDMNCCSECSNTICDKVENVLSKFKSNEYIIFESGLLEVVDEKYLNYIVNELYRIAGSKDNIFSSHHIQNNKFIPFKYFTKISNKLIGEGVINRLVIKYPPHNNFKFKKL